MTYTLVKSEVATSNNLRYVFTRKYYFGLGVKILPWPWGQCHIKLRPVPSLHHVSYTLAKFEVATASGLGRDMITGRTDFGAKLAHPIFLKKMRIKNYTILVIILIFRFFAFCVKKDGCKVTKNRWKY